MSALTPVRSADEAAAKLAAMPPFSEMGIALMGIMPDQSGALAGYKIELTKGAQADLAKVAQDTREQLADATLLAYGPTVLIPSQHWMHVAQSEAATLSHIEAIVRQEDLLPFDAGDGAKLRMVAVRFTTTDQMVVTLYRVADSMMQLKPATYLGFIRSGNLYGRLGPTDILLIRTDFDVIVIDGYAFFHRKATFEKAFGFLDKLKAESLSTFNTVTGQLNIEGLDALRAACTSQPQMMAKMSSIKRSMNQDPEYAKAMTMPKLIEYIEQHPHVDIEIVGAGDDRKLVFDPAPKRRFQILKLLDDDFLHSVLTARDYEAGSKVQSGTS